MHHKGFPITVGQSSHRLLYFPVQFLKTTIVHFTQCRLCATDARIALRTNCNRCFGQAHGDGTALRSRRRPTGLYSQCSTSGSTPMEGCAAHQGDFRRDAKREDVSLNGVEWRFHSFHLPTGAICHYHLGNRRTESTSILHNLIVSHAARLYRTHDQARTIWPGVASSSRSCRYRRSP